MKSRRIEVIKPIIEYFGCCQKTGGPIITDTDIELAKNKSKIG